MKSTPQDDCWALNYMREHGTFETSSYRYLDLTGIVHRAVWKGGKWTACCGEKIVQKVQDDDVGAITCVRCLGSGA